MRIPLDHALAQRERALQASRGVPAAYAFSLIAAFDASEPLRRVAAACWLRTVERLPRLVDK